uniref:Uncharacterized protein n=1 Tax=Ascaris lumbricoides TaxID=6252 RepID=A0A0M3ID95_ASCLU
MLHILRHNTNHIIDINFDKIITPKASLIRQICIWKFIVIGHIDMQIAK